MMDMPQMKLARTAARLSLVAVLAYAGSNALSAGTSPIRLVGVSSQGSAVLIESTEPVAYAVNRPDPLTVLVEMRNVAASAVANAVERRDPIAGVTVEQATAVDGKSVARVRVSLARPAEHKVRSARNTIRVELTPVTANASASAAPPLPGASTGATAGTIVPPATALGSVRAIQTPRSTVVTLKGNGRLTPVSVKESSEGSRRLMLDFVNVSTSAPGQTVVDSSLVTKVRVALSSRSPLVTRVVMDVTDEATYHVERAGEDGRDLSVVFESRDKAETIVLADTPAAKQAEPEPSVSMAQAIANTAAITSDADPVAALKQQPPAGRKEAPVPPPPAPAPAPRPAAEAPRVPAVTAAAPQSPTAPPQTAARAAATATPQAAPPAPPSQQAQVPPARTNATNTMPPRTQTDKRYTGAPISLDFAGADLRAILRVFAEHSGLNIIIDPSVPTTPVDILLNNLPWDQALEIVLKSYQLGFEAEGTVIRIAPLKILEDEQRQRTTLAQAKALAGDVEVRTYALSYAKATEMSPLLVKSALSQRGQIQVDPRTNTIIITDLPDRLQTAEALITSLDKPEPQVEVEARVVQTSRDFAKAIGVQWGLNGRVTPQIGNTTGLAFPNNGTLGGRTGNVNVPNDVRAGATDATATVVDLGVDGPSSAIGLALGAVNGAFNLDVALSALERSGKGRILSMPRLTTQNNVEAEVAQGIQIPIQVTANNTTTVTFKDAALKLTVTPQITSANTVIMKIAVENATADFSRSVNLIPPIDTQRVITQVQVNDGSTTVIGGIFVSREATTNDRTPVMHRIPLLGWLFKRDTSTDESRELLIFITPRIIKG